LESSLVFGSVSGAVPGSFGALSFSGIGLGMSSASAKKTKHPVPALHDHDRIHDLDTDLQFALDEKVREACAVGRVFLVLAVTLYSLT
jgi:hypothetical protein